MTTPKLDEEAIFKVARQVPAGPARRAYLEQVCTGDEALRGRVQDLLRVEDEEQSFLAAPAFGPADAIAPPLTEGPGTGIGPYKLLEQIGEGGFGLVYMAEQTRPVRRMVAVKVLKPGMDTRQVVARFEAERQALALMDHPNIARVFDGGETPAGRPYFVMELVRGVPITDFCDQNHLPVADRLGLFVAVCQAVQHAHQKGVIHRDLKPTNVLVTMHDTAPVAKVIDFGIAKALGQRLTEKTLFTSFAQMVGTPLYMSPEQAQMSGLDVDTRTDVYALGVLLYELLTGSTPFDKERLATAAYDEVRRIIREEDPPKPSTRLSTLGPAAAATVCAGRDSDPGRLSQLVRGELDWIVMKALEKDRSRRYESAGALAGDVQRHLRDDPVQACPPTAAYRFRKFARRNKRALVTAALGGLMLLAALGVAAGSIGWAARDRAAREAVLEEQAGRALEEAEAWYRRDNLPEALAAVKRAEALMASSGGSDELRDRIRRWRTDLAMVRRLEEIRLGQTTMKDDFYDHASADPIYLTAFREYGIDVLALEPVEAADRIRALAIREALVVAVGDWIWIKPAADVAGREHLLAVGRLADPNEWRNHFRSLAVQKDRRALEELADRPEVADLSSSDTVLLGRALKNAGAAPKALAVLAAAQARHPDDFWLNFEVGDTLLWRIGWDRAADAAGYYRAALVARPDDPTVHCNVGWALSAVPGHLDEGMAAYRKAIELKPDYADAHNALGLAYGKKGDWNEAIKLYQEALQLGSKWGHVRVNLGVAYYKTRQWDKAIDALTEGIELNPRDPDAHVHLGNALREKGRVDDAIAAYRQAIRINPKHADAYNALGSAYGWKKQDWARAITLYRNSISLDPNAANVHYNLGVAYCKTRLWDKAIAALAEAIRLRATYPEAHYYLAQANVQLGRWADAVAAYEAALKEPKYDAPRNGLAWLLATCPDPRWHDGPRAVQLAEQARNIAPTRAMYWNTLGAAHYRACAWKEAVAALKIAETLRPGGNGLDWFFLAMAYGKLEHKDPARQYYDRAVEWTEKHRPNDDELRRFRAEAADVLGIEKKHG
jgi:eukaryotic-like serine/threonine-protein kinase